MPEFESKIMQKSVVCEESTLIGDITISAGCVIHPSATILAEAGPIILGENCIVEEYALIANRYKSNKATSGTLIIGANNVFEVGCIVEAHRIGDKNVFESKCFVGPDIMVSSGCVIGAGTHLRSKLDLTENTVICGRTCTQREAIEKHSSQTLQIDFLRKVLPNYHHLRKPNYDPRKSRSVI